LQNLSKRTQTIESSLLYCCLIECRLKLFSDLLKVKEGDALWVFHLAHAHIDDIVKIYSIEDICLHLKSGIFFLWLAELQDLVGHEDEVASALCVLHQNDVITGNRSIYDRHRVEYDRLSLRY
jgi:hypothetical protein